MRLEAWAGKLSPPEVAKQKARRTGVRLPPEHYNGSYLKFDSQFKAPLLRKLAEALFHMAPAPGKYKARWIVLEVREQVALEAAAVVRDAVERMETEVLEILTEAQQTYAKDPSAARVRLRHLKKINEKDIARAALKEAWPQALKKGA